MAEACHTRLTVGGCCRYDSVMDEDLQITGNPLVRVLYVVLGFVFLALGIAGYLLPGLPGTVNLLVALWFFSMSSERMHRWMLTNRYFGRGLRDYKAGLGIPRNIKIIAVSAIVISISISIAFAIDAWWLRLVLIVVGAYGVWYILSRPTRESVLPDRPASR